MDSIQFLFSANIINVAGDECNFATDETAKICETRFICDHCPEDPDKNLICQRSTGGKNSAKQILLEQQKCWN